MAHRRRPQQSIAGVIYLELWSFGEAAWSFEFCEKKTLFRQNMLSTFFFYLRAIAHAADPLWESKVGAWVMHFVSIFFILIFLKFKCHGVMLIQSFEEMPFVCLWIFDVIFSKFFVLRGSSMLATTVWHVKWKGPDTLLLEPIKKKQKKKLPPAKKLRRVGLITAPCPNSGNVQVASNKENLCAT